MGDWWNEEIVQSAVVNQKFDNEVEHPAPFPEKIVVLPILQTTDIGDLVLDPFMGSGSTGMAAKDEDFDFIGIEKEKEYFEIAESRINRFAPLMNFM